MKIEKPDFQQLAGMQYNDKSYPYRLAKRTAYALGYEHCWDVLQSRVSELEDQLEDSKSEAAIWREDCEHNADRAISIAKERDELEMENKELIQWKKEQMEVYRQLKLDKERLEEEVEFQKSRVVASFGPHYDNSTNFAEINAYLRRDMAKLKKEVETLRG